MNTFTPGEKKVENRKSM